MQGLKAVIQGLFNRLGLVLLTADSFQGLQRKARLARRFQLIEAFPPGDRLGDFLKYARGNFSQLDQDLLAVLVSGFKPNGFFVEFGATNGKDLSNSLLLEAQLGWRGILAEPGLVWRSDLAKNRSAQISHKAVWNKSGETLDFVEDGELSTLSAFKNSDLHNRSGKTYQVETTTLLDLLADHNAPAFIDFLSVDTEGSEFEVLNSFDFTKHSFGLICVEHNYTPSRQKIQDLLLDKGYLQILPEVSEWDDWFVPKK